MSSPDALPGALILLIEDDTQIRRFLRTTLTNSGYRLLEATSGQEGMRLVSTQHPDLIILDLGLPDVDGLDVTEQLRQWTSTPIIVLSARDKEGDKVQALDRGADDYLTKPFGTEELLARLRVSLRHRQQTLYVETPVFSFANVRIDLEHRQVYVAEAEVHLTPIEYKLLTILVRYAGKVVTQKQLLKEIWGPTYEKETHYLRIYMGQLRHKLEADPAQPRWLITEPGVGYRLKVDE
ncbi:MAG: response regulator [Anaerolineae bacterium]|nr:response regulator [Chloroflexota bacterium]MBK9747937.1 response regulator [Chloroflexota bacterium]MBN8637426.1 response regulator [Anaerolineae bacterium]